MNHPDTLPEWLLRPGRTQATDCEATLLGTAMLHPTHATTVLSDLGHLDLVDPVHRVILTAIRDLLAEDTRPEPVLVAAAYTRHATGPLPVNTFAARVHWCLHLATVPAAAPAYRRALIEARWRRDAHAVAARITQAAEQDPATELHHTLHEALTSLGHTLARLALEPTAQAPRALPDAA